MTSRSTSQAEMKNTLCNDLAELASQHNGDIDILVLKAQLNSLFECYEENHRCYHNLSYPFSRWQLYKKLKEKHAALPTQIDPLLLILLILYKGAVYQLRTEYGWNQRASNTLAQEHMEKIGIAEPYIGWIMVGIFATIDHGIDSRVECSDDTYKSTINFFLDLDLKNLGQDKANFLYHIEDLWKEWRAVSTRSEFNSGFKIWSKRFRASRAAVHGESRIFLTRYFAENEAQAWENLKLAEEVLV